MSTATLWRLSAIIAVWLLSLSAPSATAASAAETLKAGHILYMSVGCHQCHGSVGQGSTFSGPALAPAPLGPANFRAAVRTPRNAMPAYSLKVLPDDGLDAIYAYLKAVPVGRSPDQIAALARMSPEGPVPVGEGRQTGRGRALYATHCAGCHGVQLEGATAASLMAEVEKRPADATARLIANPPRGMPKLHPAPLSDEDVAAVVEFIR